MQLPVPTYISLDVTKLDFACDIADERNVHIVSRRFRAYDNESIFGPRTWFTIIVVMLILWRGTVRCSNTFKVLADVHDEKATENSHISNLL